jgi:hypothetical protein
LFELDRLEDAAAELTAFASAAPDDARPLVLLARTVVASDEASEASIRKAAALIEQAEARNHKDRGFYDANVGYRGQVMMWDFMKTVSALPQADRLATVERMVGEVRGLAQGVSPYQPDRAAVIGLIVDLLEAMMQDGGQTVRPEFLGRAVALSQTYPTSLEVTELARTLGLFSRHKADNVAAVAYPELAPEPPEGPARKALHLAQRVAVAAEWGATEVLPKPQELLVPEQSLPADVSTLHKAAADARAVVAMYSGSRQDWEAAVESYARVMPSLMGTEAKLGVLSYATALAAIGRGPQALALLAVVPMPETAAEAGLLAFVRATLLPASMDVELALADVASKAPRESMANIGARLWLLRLARDRKDTALARGIARDLLADMPEQEQRAQGKDPGLRFSAGAQLDLAGHFTPKEASLYHLHISLSPELCVIPWSGLERADVARLAK